MFQEFYGLLDIKRNTKLEAQAQILYLGNYSFVRFVLPFISFLHNIIYPQNRIPDIGLCSFLSFLACIFSYSFSNIHLRVENWKLQSTKWSRNFDPFKFIISGVGKEGTGAKISSAKTTIFITINQNCASLPPPKIQPNLKNLCKFEQMQGLSCWSPPFKELWNIF